MSASLRPTPAPSQVPRSVAASNPAVGASPSSFQGAGAGARTTEQTTAIPITEDQERAIVQFARRSQEILYSSIQIRSSMQEIDLQYNREKNWTQAQWRARMANLAGDAHRMQDVTVPIVMPQVESCLTYLTNVFLTGYPIFGVSSGPDNEDTALMFETIIGENASTAGWVPQIMRFFRDGLKYNLHCLEVTWDQKTTWSIDTDATKPNSAAPKKVLWNGNSIRRIDLYNAFWDYRCHPYEIAEHGEFAGYTRLYSRARMKQYINDLFDRVSPATAKKALEAPIIQFTPTTSGYFPFTYFQPTINPLPRDKQFH